MELDPGFTQQGFVAHAAVEAIAAFFGTLGAFVVALVIYRKTREDQRAIFKEEIEFDLRQRGEEERAHQESIRLALHSDIQATQRRLEVANSVDDAAYTAKPETPALIHGMPGYKARFSVNFDYAANNLIPGLVERIDTILERGNPVEPESSRQGAAS